MQQTDRQTDSRVCKPSRLFQTWVLGSGLPMTNRRVMLQAGQQSSPSHHPTVGLPIHRCQTAFHVQELRLLHVLHQQETEHQKVIENIKKYHQLIASCKQKRTESQSFQYHIHVVINHH